MTAGKKLFGAVLVDADGIHIESGNFTTVLASSDTAPVDDATPKKLSIQRLSSDPTNAAFLKFSNSPGTPTNDFYLVLEEG